MKLTINVTETHILEGARLSCTDCPIALAVIDALVKESILHSLVTVTCMEVCIYGPSGIKRLVGVCNPELRTWIRDFDSGSPECKVFPGQFEIEFFSIRIATENLQTMLKNKEQEYLKGQGQ